MKNFLALITLFGVGFLGSAETSFAQLMSGPTKSMSDWRAVDPEQFRVDPNYYPRFSALQKIRPPKVAIPIPMTEIEVDDVWEVFYRVGNFYLIYSKTYTDRQCFMLAKDLKQGTYIAHISPISGQCRSRYRYCIYADLDGNVTGGWKLIYNPDLVTSKSARSQSLEHNPVEGNAWGAQPAFQKMINEVRHHNP